MDKRYFYLLIGLLVLAGSCRKEETPSEFTIADYYRDMTLLSIEVAYEPGAKPYTENTNGGNLWTFSEDNIEALFANRPMPVDVIVPSGIDQMQEIPDQQQTTFTSEEILGIAEQYRQGQSTSTFGNIFVVFLDGYLEQDGQQKTNVLGAQISNTQVAAIFKPVVEGSSSLNFLRKLAEQTTVVHELGHALGLVNFGLPLTSAHHDDDHGAHCTNDECVMYWKNEGASNITGFIQEFSQSSSVIVFGPECIDDANAYMP